MGVVQTAFSASQVLGIPGGLYIANLWNWHMTFVAIVLIAIPVGLIIIVYMRPVSGHLALRQYDSPWRHLDRHRLGTEIRDGFRHDGVSCHWWLYADAIWQCLHGEQLRHPMSDLPTIYLVSGAFTIFTGPLIGRASDAFGKFRTFIFGCALSIVMVFVYTHLGRVSLITVIMVTVLMFVGIFSRMIPSQALMSAIPEITKRGSFNAVNASAQQISGGIASVIAGVVVAQGPSGDLQHFDRLGYIVIATTLVSLGLMYFIQRTVAEVRH